MKQAPLVSIVMPVYNREKTVESSVQSILNQSYQNWILIIVDDNSDDNSLSVIKKLCESDSRIRYKTNTEYSHSCAGARLSGITEITSKYAAFLDSDDTWPTVHLAEMVTYLESNNDIDYVFGDLSRIDVNGNVVVGSKFRDEGGLPKSLQINWDGKFGVLIGRGNLAVALSERFNTGMHTAVFKSSFLSKVKLRDVYGCEDVLLTFEALFNDAKIAVHNKSHLNYLVHEDNVSSVNPKISFSQLEKNCFSEVNFYKNLIPTYLKLSIEEERARRHKLAEIYVWHLAYATYRKNGKKQEALKAICKGIRLAPKNIDYYKAFISTLVKMQ